MSEKRSIIHIVLDDKPVIGLRAFPLCSDFVKVAEVVEVSFDDGRMCKDCLSIRLESEDYRRAARTYAFIEKEISSIG